jgi:Spy/CpxP family protein refolding chaperone
MSKLIISLMLVVFFLASGSQAQQMTGPGRDTMTPRMERNQMDWGRGPMHQGRGGSPAIPDLTDEQKAQLEKLQIEHMKNVQPLHNQLAEKQAQLHTLSTAEQVDMSKINGLIDEIGKIRTEMMKERERHHQAIRKMLTEKQRLFIDNRPGHRHWMED